MVFGLDRDRFSDLFFVTKIYQNMILILSISTKSSKNRFRVQFASLIFAHPLLGGFKYGENLNMVKVIEKLLCFYSWFCIYVPSLVIAVSGLFRLFGRRGYWRIDTRLFENDYVWKIVTFKFKILRRRKKSRFRDAFYISTPTELA